MFIKQIFIGLIFLSAFIAADSQDRSQYFTFGEPYKASVIVLPHSSNDSLHAIVMHRISYETLQFTRTRKGGLTTYAAETEVNITFRNSEGIVKNRTFWRDTVITTDFSETSMKNKWVEGAIQTDLPLGNYMVEIEFDTKSRYRKNKIELAIDYPEGFYKSNDDATFVFAEKNEEAGITTPFIDGDKILFNPEGASIKIFTEVSDVAGQYIFKFEKLTLSEYQPEDPEPGDEPVMDSELVYSGSTEPKKDTRIELITDRREVYLIDKPFKNDSLTTLYFDIEFPSDKLQPGSYRLKLYDEQGDDTLQKRFVVNWENRPQSLQDTEGAVEYMYYILDDEKFESLKSLNDEKQEKAFMQYWDNIDPTPQTPFNEALYQYYSRVDYAFFNYRTLVEKDGAKTDRGKIYILYGSPDQRDEGFEGDESVIRWKYDKLKKEFLFTAISTGVYRLTAINEI